MTVFLSPIGGAAGQFLDNNGNPLAGGKVYTYLAGTTTPAATYTSYTGITAHPNPIILNAGGRVPDSGEIWLGEGGDGYKFVLTTSADVGIGTWDNIAGINGTGLATAASNVSFTGFEGQTGTVQDLADDDGSNWIGFLSDGDSAVARSVQSKLRDVVSVKDFGAVGDGTTDDDAAIQAAVDFVQTRGGGTVYFPFGDYPCSIVVSAPNVTLLGEPGTILRAQSSDSVVDVTATGTAFTLDGFDIRGQTLANEPISNAGGTVNNTNALHCIRVYAEGSTLRNFKTSGARQDGIYFRIAGAANALIEDFYIGSTARNPVSIIEGIGFTWVRGTVYLNNLYTSTYGSGLYLFDVEPNSDTDLSSNHSFTDVVFDNGGATADNWNVMFHRTNIDSTNSLYASFTRCKFVVSGTGSAAASIRLENDANPYFEQIHIAECEFDARVLTIAGATSQNVKNSSFCDIVLGNTSFTFGTTVGDGCSLQNIVSTAGSLSISGATTNEVTLINVMSHNNRFPKSTDVIGTSTVIGSDVTISKSVVGDSGVDGGTTINVAKRLVVADGTTGQVLLTISGVDTNRVAQVWEVTVNTQAQGSGQSRRQRSQKIAFMVTTASGGVPVVDMISGYGWAEQLSSTPSGGDRDPGSMSLAVAVNGSNEVVITANVTNTVSSGSNILNVYAVGTGRRINATDVN